MIKIETITPDLVASICRKITTPELGYLSNFERQGYTRGHRCIFLKKPL